MSGKFGDAAPLPGPSLSARGMGEALEGDGDDEGTHSGGGLSDILKNLYF